MKPEFFFDEELAKLKPTIRLFFIGLFTQADKDGKMEDRPERLKANIFPYESFNADAALNDLSGKFIIRYEVSGRKYLKINSFIKHQRPHHTEVESEIPEPNGDITVKARLETAGEGKGKEKGKERKEVRRSAPPTPRFTKPNPQDVTVYAQSIGYKLSGQKFCDFYESKGWKIGNTPMKDWKASVRTWKSKDADPAPAPIKASTPSPIAQADMKKFEEDKRRGEQEEADFERDLSTIKALPTKEYDVIYTEAIKRLPQGKLAETVKASLLPVTMVEVWREKKLVAA